MGRPPLQWKPDMGDLTPLSLADFMIRSAPSQRDVLRLYTQLNLVEKKQRNALLPIVSDALLRCHGESPDSSDVKSYRQIEKDIDNLWKNSRYINSNAHHNIRATSVVLFLVDVEKPFKISKSFKAPGKKKEVELKWEEDAGFDGPKLEVDFTPFHLEMPNNPLKTPLETDIDSTMSSPTKTKSKAAPPRVGQPVSSDVINELVDGSSSIIDEMLKELNSLIGSEVDPARKEALVKIRTSAMKERANFRVLTRHIASAASAPKTALDATENGFDEGSTGDFKKDFEMLPEKLVEKFARDLPGWCLHVERPEILHLGHCRYDAADREFFCDAVISLLHRPDTLDRVFVNVLFLDPDTNDVAKKNQRFCFPIQDILATIVPLMKSTEGNWPNESRQRLAAAARATADAAAAVSAAYEDFATASSEIHVKSEPTEEHSCVRDDSLAPPPFFESESLFEKPKQRDKLGTVIVEGKRRRKSRLSQETLQEALAGFDDDIMYEDEVVEDSKAQFVKLLEERRKDEDFVPRNKSLNEEEILGNCFQCYEFLKKGQALTHMADKHPDDIVNRMQCPICSQTPNSTLEDHLQKRHSKPARLELMHICPVCSKAFTNKYVLQEHIINVHKPDEKNFKCGQCEVKLASDRLLKLHLANKHNARQEKGKKKKSFFCYICAKEYFKQASLKDHEVRAHGSPEDYKFNCPECGKRFGSKKNLLHHLQTHTNERKFECPVCKKCFKTIGNLKQHKYSHGPPKYECEECGQKFSFGTGLLNHVRAIHGLKKPKEPLSEESKDVPVSEESME